MLEAQAPQPEKEEPGRRQGGVLGMDIDIPGAANALHRLLELPHVQLLPRPLKHSRWKSNQFSTSKPGPSSGACQLSEFYTFDFNDDVVLIGHSGSGDACFSTARKASMEIVPVFHGKTGGGFLTRFYPKPGPVTYLASHRMPTDISSSS